LQPNCDAVVFFFFFWSTRLTNIIFSRGHAGTKAELFWPAGNQYEITGIRFDNLYFVLLSLILKYRHWHRPFKYRRIWLVQPRVADLDNITMKLR
jgi:hypothetical protein